MNTAQTTSPRNNRVAAIVELDGQRFGQVVLRGGWFVASRKSGTEKDIRRMSQFRSLDRAVAWIEAAV